MKKKVVVKKVSNPEYIPEDFHEFQEFWNEFYDGIPVGSKHGSTINVERYTNDEVSVILTYSRLETDEEELLRITEENIATKIKVSNQEDDKERLKTLIAEYPNFIDAKYFDNHILNMLADLEIELEYGVGSFKGRNVRMIGNVFQVGENDFERWASSTELEFNLNTHKGMCDFWLWANTFNLQDRG